MTYTGRRHALVLLTAFAAVLAAALAPAGLHATAVPAWAWAVWAAVFLAALVVLRRAGVLLPDALRRLSWLLPAVLLLTGPAAFLARPGTRVVVALALCSRALSAASLGMALATWLGPSGLARAARQLRVPDRLADVFEATLASLSIVLAQVRAMLRAREARRPGFGAWSDLAAAPVETVRGFGRLVASLLLRALERAEAVELARRARGGTA